MNVFRKQLTKMSTGNSDSGGSLAALSFVAQFDDLNRLNGVLNDAYAEECKSILQFCILDNCLQLYCIVISFLCKEGRQRAFGVFPFRFKF